MATRGGHRRGPVEPVDMDDLSKIWQSAIAKWGREAFSLGNYDSIKSTQACSARGLSGNEFFIREIMKISNGEILCSQMKQSILKHASTHNFSALKDDLWAAQIAHRMVCMMSHYRRLRRSSEKVRQCLANATGVERQIIKELLALEPGKACKKAEQANVKTADIVQENETHAGSSNDKAPKRDKKATVVTRELHRKISPVSLDSEGFPMMLKSPDSDANACKKAEKASGKRSLKRELSSVSVDSDGFPSMLQSPPQKSEKGSDHILKKRRDGLQRAKLDEAAEAAARELADKSPKKKGKLRKRHKRSRIK